MEALSIEEAKTLEAFFKHKNIAKAAASLKKANSAVVYALDSIERKSEMKLFDRSGYRTEFLPAGERVLEGCRKLLAASDELMLVCEELKLGFESDLEIIVEGVVPMDPIIQGVKMITDAQSPTRFHIQSEFMNEVEETYLREGAHLMISVLPPEKSALSSVPLFKVPALLVAASEHPLFRTERTSSKLLKSFPILTVRGSSPKLNMATSTLEGESRIQFNDFSTKKLAVMRGLGYGWLPEYLIRDELNEGTLRLIRWEKPNRHIFHPHLYHRGELRLGRTAKSLIHYLTQIKKW